MALLTADDVLNKTFQSVKFREGYDQIEVDEFLDEVVATIYALTVENTELKQKLAEADQRIEELQSGAPQAAQETVVEAAVVEEPAAEAAPAAVEQAAVVEETAPAAEASDPQAATAMLALAQRLHDEYVNDGRAEGERIVAEAREEGHQIVEEAKTKRDDILNQLRIDQAGLEDSINGLRAFEADYRSSISEHLQKLLSDLNKEGDQ